MTSIANIEEILNIETADKRLCNGKFKSEKNRFFYYKDQYYIIEVAGDRWFIASDCRRTRQLLRSRTWYVNGGYIKNCKDKLQFHRETLRCDDDLLCDHINRDKFDNRVNNLRMVTAAENSRNKTKASNNTSGKQGIYKQTMGSYDYWRVEIRNPDGKRICRCFNIDKLGNDEAFVRAVQSRQDLEREYGYSGE